MRVDDVMVCVRDAPRSPRGTTEPVLSYICLTSADRYNTFADRPSPLGEYLRAFTDHSRSFTFPKRCNSSSELIRNLFGCSVFIRLSSDDNTNDSPVVFKRSRHWESRPPVSSQSAEVICPQKLDRSQTGWSKKKRQMPLWHLPLVGLSYSLLQHPLRLRALGQKLHIVLLRD